ncbi:hypothetical protein [Paractinoplanes rishiriensis]|uniref:hypothetical protein n=1 Tax=Paractinoplanes rishiriensis TaxID=1050105 RepID=UPI001940E4A1|nr:hypothetical protein [Actinoplanes rishiriensis]
MPVDYKDTGSMIGHDCHFVGDFHPFKTADDGERYMLELVRVVQDTVFPFLEEYGTLEGYLGWCKRANNQMSNRLGDPHFLYRQAATAIILRSDEEAAGALLAVQQIAANHPAAPTWLQELSSQAADLHSQLDADPAAVRKTLLSGVNEQRRRRGLPATAG